MAKVVEYLNALPPKSRLEEYEFLGVLGSGGFGVTYRGFDHLLGKTVAIKEYLPNDLAVRAAREKILPKSTADQEDFDWGLERFLEEARALAHLRPSQYHPRTSFLSGERHRLHRHGLCRRRNTERTVGAREGAVRRTVEGIALSAARRPRGDAPHEFPASGYQAGQRDRTQEERFARHHRFWRGATGDQRQVPVGNGHHHARLCPDRTVFDARRSRTRY